MLKFVSDAKLRASSILREWKEKREEAKAQKQAAAALHSEHGHGRFFLLTVPATATIFAAIVEVYWAFLFCIEATGHLLLDFSTAVGSDAASTGAWHFAFTVNSVAVLIGLACATVPIVMISMVWLPVQFTMRGTGRWRRGTMIFCGILANILVIVSGTVVMNGNRQEQVREGVVAEQSAAQGRAAIDARLAFEQEQLRLALNNTNPYLNQAANVGAAEWERSYVAQARATNDPRLPQLERALGAARAADERRANIERLTVERATAAPEAATAAVVEDTDGRALNEFATAVQVWRPPFVAFICTLVGIFGSWWVLALMQGLNPRDVLRSGWADEGHRIEDMREQEAVKPQPMERQREVVTDAETGEELVRVRESKPRDYWRRVKKGKPTRVNIDPDIPPDETGFTDTKRTAVTLGGEMELPESATAERLQDEKAARDHADSSDDHDRDTQSVSAGAELLVAPVEETEKSEQGSQLQEQQNDTSEELFPIEEEYLEPTLPVSSEQLDEGNGENTENPADENQDEPREPETREDRMLPSSVAAE